VRLYSLPIALLALSQAGCFSSRLVRVEANPAGSLIAMHLKNRLAVFPFETREEDVFLACVDRGEVYECKHVCEGFADPPAERVDFTCTLKGP
jgi:hypothetical protein